MGVHNQLPKNPTLWSLGLWSNLVHELRRSKESQQPFEWQSMGKQSMALSYYNKNKQCQTVQKNFFYVFFFLKDGMCFKLITRVKISFQLAKMTKINFNYQWIDALHLYDWEPCACISSTSPKSHDEPKQFCHWIQLNPHQGVRNCGELQWFVCWYNRMDYDPWTWLQRSFWCQKKKHFSKKQTYTFQWTLFPDDTQP